MRERGDVDLEHLALAFLTQRLEMSDATESRIVDEKIDLLARVAQVIAETLRNGGIREIRRER